MKKTKQERLNSLRRLYRDTMNEYYKIVTPWGFGDVPKEEDERAFYLAGNAQKIMELHDRIKATP